MSRAAASTLLVLGLVPMQGLGIEPVLRALRYAVAVQSLPELSVLTTEQLRLPTEHESLDVYLSVLPVTGHGGPGAWRVERSPAALSPLAFRAALRDLRPAADAAGAGDGRAIAVEVHPLVTEKGVLTFSFLGYDFDASRTRRLCTFDAPVKGPVAEWQAVSAAAARRLEEELRCLADLRDSAAHQPRASTAENAAALRGAATWELLPTTTPLRYRFAPPIDDYGGVVTRVRGSLRLEPGPGNNLEISAARFVTDVATLSTGAEDLDDSLHSDMFLDVARFPEATFKLAAVHAVRGTPTAPDGQRLTLAGSFRLKDRRIPLNAYVSLIAEDGRGAPRLRMRGRFALNLRAFDLWPPEGPEPSQHIMLFELDFLFEPER